MTGRVCGGACANQVPKTILQNEFAVLLPPLVLLEVLRAIGETVHEAGSDMVSAEQRQAIKEARTMHGDVLNLVVAAAATNDVPVMQEAFLCVEKWAVLGIGLLTLRKHNCLPLLLQHLQSPDVFHAAAAALTECALIGLDEEEVPGFLQLVFPALTALMPTVQVATHRAVQFHPHGGQFDFVWLSARTPHGAYVW